MVAQLNFGAGDCVTFGTVGNSTSTTASFNKSSLTNIVVGDLLVAWIHNQSSTVGATITPPASWIHYGANPGSLSSSASRLSSFYYYPIRSQTDITNLAATSTWTFSVSGARVGCVVARATGIDLDNIEDSASASFAAGSNTATWTIPSITTNNATTLLVAGTFGESAASTNSPTVTGLLTSFTQYKTSPSGSANANTVSGMGYSYLTSAGATGAITVTYDLAAATSSGELVAFKAGPWSAPVVPIERPTIVGTPTTFTTSGVVTSFTINKPGPLRDGDALILALSAQTPTATGDFACNGWSRISQAFEASSPGDRIIAFYALPVPVARSVTDTSFTFTSIDATGGRIAAEMFVVRGAELSNLTSAISPYGHLSSQTTTVQPGTPSVSLNLLLVGYNANFTSVPDYTIATGPSGMTLQNFIVNSTGAVSKTVLAVYREDVDSGAISAMAADWNTVPAQSAGAAVVIRGASQLSTNGGAATHYTSATDTLSNGSMFYTSATDVLSTPLEVRPVPAGYSSVTTMLATSPFYVAHRGGSLDWPEMSLHAYTQSVFWGVGAVELSLARTSDGVWFGLHDATLDRTSGTTGFTASAHTWAEVQAYQITAAATNNPAQSARPYMRWEELMAAYYGTHIIFVDPKVAIAFTSELLNMMDAMPNTPTSHFVGKNYGVSGPVNNSSGWAHDLAARGYKSWGYFYQADAANFATYQGRWDILGMDYTADAPTWASIMSYGKPVIGHIIPDAAAVTTALGYGAVGVMVSGVAEAIPRTP